MVMLAEDNNMCCRSTGFTGLHPWGCRRSLFFEQYHSNARAGFHNSLCVISGKFTVLVQRGFGGVDQISLVDKSQEYIFATDHSLNFPVGRGAGHIAGAFLLMQNHLSPHVGIPDAANIDLRRGGVRGQP